MDKGRPPSPDNYEIALAQAERLAKFEHRLYVYGRIAYKDVFPIDKSADHATQRHLMKYGIEIKKIDLGNGSAKWAGKEVEGQWCFDYTCPKNEYPCE